MSDNKEKWHLKKEVTISQLITTALAIASIFLWVSGIETRLSIQENNIKVINERIDRGDNRFDGALKNIQSSVRRIEDYLLKKK